MNVRCDEVVNHQIAKPYKYALLLEKNQAFFVFFVKIFKKAGFVGFD